MRGRTKIILALVLGLLGLMVIGLGGCAGAKPDKSKPARAGSPATIENAELEEPARPEIHLTREGHMIVAADRRLLGWEVSDPSGLASVDVRIVRVEDRTMEQEIVYESKEPSGRVDLGSIGRGPGLYALLVEARNNEKDENEAGLRFSYTDVDPDCPNERAWWPRAVDSQASGAQGKRDVAPVDPRANDLVTLSRQSRYVVRGKVERLTACPTKEGHLFTYIQLDGVETLQKDGAEAAPTTLILRIPGGMAHGRVEVVTDAPILRSNEEVLLFLTRDPRAQVPIVHGVGGVFFPVEGGRLRSYGGPLVTGVGKDFSLEIDSSHDWDPKYARHWDPNMRARWKAPATAAPIGERRVDSPRASKEAMRMDSFTGQLDRAWAEADVLGRWPPQVSKESRRPYGEMPRREPQGR